MHRRHALHQVVPDNDRHAAPVSGKRMHELRFRRVGGYISDPFDAAGKRLDEHRSIRPDAWLFRADVRVTLCAGVEVRGLQQLQVRKAPYLRSEEHTSELQSQSNLVCRLLLEKKN